MLKNSKKLWIVVVVAWMAIHVSYSACAAEWGSLKGRFVVDGTPPTPPPLALITKDEYCIQKKPPNESVVVGKGNGLANAVVYLRLGPGKKVDVHPDYAAKLKEPAVIDNNGCQFHPHVVLVRVGQQFVIKNSDPVGHNTKGSLFANGAFNPTVPAGEDVKMTFGKVESLPMPVNCSIHPFMAGHMLVQDHPYMAVSKDDGTFEITNIPAGTNEFQFWHEVKGYMKNLKLNKGGTADIRGRAKLTIAAGQTLDLGDIKVPISALK